MTDERKKTNKKEEYLGKNKKGLTIFGPGIKGGKRLKGSIEGVGQQPFKA